MNKILFLTLLTGMMTVSCTENFLEYNRNPYGVSDATLASGGIAEQMANHCGVLSTLVIPLQENLFQYSMSLGCETLSGYMGQTKHSDLGRYNYNIGFIEYPFTDEQSLAKVIKQYNALSLVTGASQENVFYAWGTILKVGILHRLSDMYGPIPYEFSGTEAQKAYQTQEYIYRKMIEELGWAGETLAKVTLSASEKKAWAVQDDIYRGDISKWVKFANSLKLRLAIRVSAKLPEEARKWAEEAVKKGVIEHNTENAWKPTSDNPFYKMSQNWGDTRCGADIIAYMNAFEDPRREAYFEKTGRGGNETYFGLRAGVNLPAKEELISTATNLYSKPKVSMTDPVAWMTAAEVYFLRAEGALKKWNMGDQAQNLYQKGIETSLGMYNLTAGEYLNNQKKRGSFRDSHYPAFNNPSFTSDIQVKWADNEEANLAQIITQKYIAMYPYGSAEAWAEWRRTGYPNLLPAVDYNHEVNNIERDGKGADTKGYRRYPLPQIEHAVNSIHVTNAITEDLEGNDSPNTNVWWARK